MCAFVRAHVCVHVSACAYARVPKSNLYVCARVCAKIKSECVRVASGGGHTGCSTLHVSLVFLQVSWDARGRAWFRGFRNFATTVDN